MSIVAEKLFKETSMAPMTYEIAEEELLGKIVQVHKQGVQDPESPMEVQSIAKPPSRTAKQAGVLYSLCGRSSRSTRTIVVTRHDTVQKKNPEPPLF